MSAAFKPSDVTLMIPPLTGTMGKSEVEYAAALIVFVCTAKGDAWQPVTFADVRAAAKEAESAAAPSARQKWLLAALGNPFLHPDVHGLIARGFAEKLPGPSVVVQLLPAAMTAIERWVQR